MGKRIHLFIGLFVAVMLMACNGSEPAVDASSVPVTYVMKTGDARIVADLEIEGMMCEMACGGKIQKELEALDGVKIADIDFADERPSNHAVVEYDPAKLDEHMLIQTVQQIADGKLYTVKSVTITSYQSSGETSSRKEKKQEKDFEVKTVFEFPNVVRILEKLLR